MKDTDIQKIAKQVAIELRRTDSVVVKASDVAAMCGYTPDSNPVRRILSDPTFPPAVELTPGGQKRYLREAVEEWIRSHFVAQSELAMATR